MQQRVGAAECFEHLHATGQLGLEPGEPAEQAIAQRALFRRRLDPGRRQPLEDGDGVAHVRREERRAEATAVVATLRQQGVARGAGVELGNEIHHCGHAPVIRI